MRFPLDQDVYVVTARFLAEKGHDVVTAAEMGLAQAEDLKVLQVARNEERILVTRDKDYGGLVFLSASPAGVIYLRILPSTTEAIHKEIDEVLRSHSEDELSAAFVVVEPGRHRIRKLPGE